MEYFIHILILFSIYAILGVGLNLVVGFTGLLSVMHAAFFGVGAYATALLLTGLNINFFIALLLGIILSALVAFLLGIVLSKFRDDYYALASLGFNAMIFSVFLNWQSLTRGPLGIPGIPRPALKIGSLGLKIDSNFSFLILSFVFLVFVYLMSRFTINSSFGRCLKAIREDEDALKIFGYKTHYFKLAVFVISAAVAAVAGALFATYITFIDPSSFNVSESIFILTIVILGGLASLRGSLIGALFLIILPEALRFVGFPSDIAAQTRVAAYGIILILLMLYRPQGIVGEYKL